MHISGYRPLQLRLRYRSRALHNWRAGALNAALNLLAATTLLAGISVAVLPISQSSASTYDVSICGLGTESAGTSDGLSVVDSGGSDGYMNTVNLCSSGGPGIVQHAFVPNSSYTTWTWNGDGHWTLTAPANTTIGSLSLWQKFTGFQSYFTFDLSTPDGRLIERASTWSVGVPANGSKTFVINAASVSGRFYCALSSCSGSGTRVDIGPLTPRISDPYAPTLTAPPGGSLFGGGTLRGTKGVSFSATDLGSGIYKVGLIVDGHDEQLTTPDANGERCVKPFSYLVPCPLSVNSSFTVDTTEIPDGEHEIQVVVYDATEEGRAVSAPFTVTVHNNTKAVKPKVTLKISPTHTANRHTIHWKGRVISDSLPRHGVTVLAQVKQGKSWIVFRQIRTDAKGRFKFDYRFHATTITTTYTFRVSLAQGGYYFLRHANSMPIKVHVKP